MQKRYHASSEAIASYVQKVFAPEDDVLREIRTRSTAAGLPEIQVAPTDGVLLEILARANGARRVVEIGTLGGYSGVWLLRGLAPGGTLDTFEIEPHHAEVARESFRRAGFAERARVHVGPAREKLAGISGQGPFDVVFIDADKVGYPDYLAWAAENLRVGGLVLGDNVFLFGRVVEEPVGEHAESIRAMRKFHQDLVTDRFRSTIVPTGEGLAVGVKIK